MKVLYMVGHARCGSTVLGNLLNEVRGVAHAGEVVHLPRKFLHANVARCGCRARLAECDVWGNIQAAGPLGSLHHSFAARTHASWVVDTSKLPGYLHELIDRLGTEDLRVVHLVRNPCASIHSMMRRKRYKDERDGRRRTPFLDLARTAKYALRWRSDLAKIERIGVDVVVRYEDFAADPQATLESICDLMGIPCPRLVSEDGIADLGVNHAGMGNRNRFRHGPVEIRTDDRWERDMRRLPRAIVWAITRRAARPYGYR